MSYPLAALYNPGVRKTWAVIFNLLVPGSGLIILRREWLGLTVSLLFGILAQVATWGQWLIPLSLPRFMVLGSAVGATAVWVAAQVLLAVQWRWIFTPGMDAELERLLVRADEALAQGRLPAAHQILLVAQSLNDEHPGVNRRWALLMERMGLGRHARAAWSRVLKLAASAEDHRQAREALAACSEKI